MAHIHNKIRKYKGIDYYINQNTASSKYAQVIAYINNKPTCIYTGSFTDCMDFISNIK